MQKAHTRLEETSAVQINNTNLTRKEAAKSLSVGTNIRETNQFLANACVVTSCAVRVIDDDSTLLLLLDLLLKDYIWVQN